ncbi:hypothetical protein CLF_111470, partial [Clonorchis sinensis]
NTKLCGESTESDNLDGRHPTRNQCEKCVFSYSIPHEGSIYERPHLGHLNLGAHIKMGANNSPVLSIASYMNFMWTIGTLFPAATVSITGNVERKKKPWRRRYVRKLSSYAVKAIALMHERQSYTVHLSVASTQHRAGRKELCGADGLLACGVHVTTSATYEAPMRITHQKSRVKCNNNKRFRERWEVSNKENALMGMLIRSVKNSDRSMHIFTNEGNFLRKYNQFSQEQGIREQQFSSTQLLTS